MSIRLLVFQTIRTKERFREIFAYPEILLVPFLHICINLIHMDDEISDNVKQNHLPNRNLGFFGTMAQQSQWNEASSLSRIHDHTQTHHTR
jgi:hypothetical protein